MTKTPNPTEQFNPRHAPMYAMHNKNQITENLQCGCYNCTKVFMSKEIVDWTDDNKTAICPICGVDCVLPGITTDLEQIKKMWLNSTIVTV